MTGLGEPPNISKLRLKRLLILAENPRNHKRWFKYYYWLDRWGYVEWAFGHAFITDAGMDVLEELQCEVH